MIRAIPGILVAPLAVWFLFSTGCTGGESALGGPAPAAAPVLSSVEHPGWREDVQPFLVARCGSCHGAEQPAAGLDVTTWDALIAGSDFGEALIAYDPGFSLMLELGHRLPEHLPAEYLWRHTAPYETFRDEHRLAPAEVDFLARWIRDGARGPAGETPFESPAGRVFVAVQDAGMVSIIDVDALVVARNVHFGAFGGRAATPHDTDYEPDGSAWYVTLINAQHVVRLDATTNEVVAHLDVTGINPTYKPGMLAVDPTSDRMYLSRSISDISGGRSIMAIERSTMAGEEILVPYTRPHPIGLTRDGRFILSGSLADNLVAAIQAETFDLTSPLRLDGTRTPLMHYDVAPDGRTAAITGQFSNLLYILDISDPQQITLLHAVPVGQEPWYPAYSADGSHVIVPNHRSNSVSMVDVASGSVTHTITDPRFAMPHGAAASHDGRYIFVSNGNLTHDTATGHGGHGAAEDHETMGGFGEQPAPYQPRFPLDRSGDGIADNLGTGHVAVIDARTLEVIRVIELEEFPSGLSLWQAGYPHR
jgi:YVTN family beta-propeller protein